MFQTTLYYYANVDHGITNLFYIFFRYQAIEDHISSSKDKGNNGTQCTNVHDEIPIITDAVAIPDDAMVNQPPVNPAYMAPSSTASPSPALAVINPPTQFTRPTPYYNIGRNPVGLQCPHCKRQTVTVVHDLIGTGTLIAVFLLALFFWPLCWLPFCIPSCRRTHHFCGHNECRQRVGETSVCA